MPNRLLRTTSLSGIVARLLYAAWALAGCGFVLANPSVRWVRFDDSASPVVILALSLVFLAMALFSRSRATRRAGWFLLVADAFAYVLSLSPLQ